ncbi:MAG: HTH domain-containing protein [Phenylobacterium sp.]
MTGRTAGPKGAALEDLKILAILEGRPLPRGQALADALGVSVIAAWSHIRRLKGLSLLAFVSPVKFRPETCECITYLKIQGTQAADLVALDARIAADPAVTVASRITGGFDYRLHSVHEDYRRANDWSRNLDSHPAVARISTRYCRTLFDRRSYAAAILGSAPD